MAGSFVVSVLVSCSGEDLKKEDKNKKEVWSKVFEAWESKKCSATFYYQIEKKTDTIYSDQVDWKKESSVFESIKIGREEANNYERIEDSLDGNKRIMFTKKLGKLPLVSLQIAESKSGRIIVKGRTREKNRLYTYEKNLELDSYHGYVIQIEEQTLLGDTISHRMEVKVQCHD